MGSMAIMDQAQLMATPSLPFSDDDPIFTAPWQAQAFAITVQLSEEGHFTWPEWVQYLSTEITAASDDVPGDSLDVYYRQWLAALEKLVTDKGLASRREMGRRKEDWRRAYQNTPHGSPVEITFENSRTI